MRMAEMGSNATRGESALAVQPPALRCKFTDADLRGLPLRVVIGERSLAAGGAELSRRGEAERHIVPLNELGATLREEIATLHAPFT